MASGGKRRGYAFAYDGLNRLTRGCIPREWQWNLEAYAYDKQGNPTGILNLGDDVLTDAERLSLTYNGNQLATVTNINPNPTSIDYTGFKDFNTVGDDYAYDRNGNVTKDLSKNILSIQYNSLNLPDYIYTADGGRHAFLYDYDGNKLYANANASAWAVLYEKH